ncbi:MAG: hypothetical protein ABH867_04355 [Patescibacteria group bacterium]
MATANHFGSGQRSGQKWAKVGKEVIGVTGGLGSDKTTLTEESKKRLGKKGNFDRPEENNLESFIISDCKIFSFDSDLTKIPVKRKMFFINFYEA